MSKVWIKLALIGVMGLAIGVSWPSTAQADRTVYVVESGDALSRLARRFNVTVAQIRDWNDLETDVIRVGQELVIYPGRGGSGASATYVVANGDTISSIAQRYDCTVSDIVSWNRGLDPDRIRVGQELTIRGNGRAQRRIVYEIGPGDFIARVARRYDVSVSDIERWNRGLDPDNVRIGEEIVIYVEGPERRSESVGRANHGRLLNGEQLPTHRAYRIRNRDLAWGTNETIAYILDGFDAVRRRYPDAARVWVHDLSDENGGRLSGHRSHQSGRDADIGYYRNDCRGTCEYENISADDLDVARQWWLIRHWINHGQIQYIFMDYRLQEPLYEHVRSRGATRAQLDEWFQYPHGRRRARGLIRHEPNHRDHMHVRFSCSDDDDECR